MVVIVTGANGQLGKALQHIAPDSANLQFHFYASTNIDITQRETIELVWQQLKPDFCINAAAYTAVDKAEAEPDKAKRINVDGARNLAEVCRTFNTTLLHISTDFVFDGKQSVPYTETDNTNPQSVYGVTKRDGELAIADTMQKYFIIRTSWLYSQFGNNFMKTMLRLAQERGALSVVDDQIGTPTHAIDLAQMIVNIIQSKSNDYGIYHFSNAGSTSWYGFAKKIFELNGVSINLSPIPTIQYPTPAKRPEYSVLDTSKIKKIFMVQITNWDVALEKYTNRI